MDKPAFLDHDPVSIAFGTSGMRALVSELTDLQVYVSVKGALRYLLATKDVRPGHGVVLGGDLRPSTPRIMRAAAQAIFDSGLIVDNVGMVPTPALVNYGIATRQPGVMITGSHIPFDRNGIKISKSVGELLKSDEPGILAAIDGVRREEYAKSAASSRFDAKGMLKFPRRLPSPDPEAALLYADRYERAFTRKALAGFRIALYEHSAVGRDLILSILTSLGAEVVPVGRSNEFVAIDTENIDDGQLELLERLVGEAEKRGPIDAIVSTDGDSDRPLMAAVLPERDPESGRRIRFLPGDLLGLVVARHLGADVVAVPVSANDAIDSALRVRNVKVQRTRIGSPYVVAAMMEATAEDGDKRVMGWEANGGFLVASTIGDLGPLPTRDAVLPILVNLVAAKYARVSLATLWSRLPPRFGRSGLIDGVPVETSRDIVSRLIVDRRFVADLFSRQLGLGQLVAMSLVDGVRLHFASGDIAHVRASGNAPQLRVYAVADSDRRADAIVRSTLHALEEVAFAERRVA
jgi:phosphomannomutase